MRNSRYNKLEGTMTKYRNLIDIPVAENNERLITITTIPSAYATSMDDMRPILGNASLVRQSVVHKLETAQKILQDINPNLSILVTYGYRTLETQTNYFLKELKNIAKIFFPNPIDLYEEVHRYIAVPTVAGHPTGGAVDVVIIDQYTRKTLDFGSKQYSFKKEDCYTYSPYIAPLAKRNRLFLRLVMMKAGFAPFDGEWWHFSYGDREWAYYYKKPAALYDQIEYKNLKKKV